MSGDPSLEAVRMVHGPGRKEGELLYRVFTRIEYRDGSEDLIAVSGMFLTSAEARLCAEIAAGADIENIGPELIEGARIAYLFLLENQTSSRSDDILRGA